MTTNRIRISLSKREIEYLLEKIPEKTYQGKPSDNKEAMTNNLLRYKLQQAGIKLMFGGEKE